MDRTSDLRRPLNVVLGATGHVGSAVARALLDRGEAVTVVTRDRRRAEALARGGAEVAVVDVRDVPALRELLRRGRRAFLLNPPADPGSDTVTEERRTASAIAAAVADAELEKVVLQSTYGAQPGEGIGDLGVLYELEQALSALPLRTSVVRGAFYMSNWDTAIESARREGVVYTFLPPDFAIPMVAPQDLGRVGARLLTDELAHTGVRHVEGPTLYSAADVARAFGAALGRDVRAVEVPRARWTATLEALGFSPAAAASYARMVAVTLDGAWERPRAPERGATTLSDHLAALVRRQA